MTTGQRTSIGTPANGLMVYDITTNSLWIYNSNIPSWVQQSTGGASLWATSGTAIYNTNTGNVGIGISAPTAKLHLAGSMKIDGGLIDIDDNTAKVRLLYNGSAKGYFSITSSTGDIQIGTNVGSNDLGKLQLETKSSPRLTILPDGNVGIGVLTPDAKLHVNGAIRADGNLLLEDGLISMHNNTDNQYWHLSYNTSAGYLSFMDMGVPRLSLKNGGNIGINNIDPLTKLHIAGGQDAGLTSSTNGYIMLGSSSSGNLIIDNNEIIVRSGFTTAGTLNLQNDGGEVAIGARTTINKDGEALKLDGNNPTLRFYQNGAYRSTIGVSSANDLSLTTTGGAVFITPGGASAVINPSGGGNVLISPTGGGDVIVNPNSGGYIQLNPTGGGQVVVGNVVAAASAYKLTVTGKVICEELKVKLSSSWPDYVFSKNYKLPALSEIEKFIEENKHLPNIPSAIEIEKNGIEVGDMQKRMMEKIEQLTLYIIDLKKEIDLLKRNN
jgi:hypothetical protein